jgi:hypothetical protein
MGAGQQRSTAGGGGGGRPESGWSSRGQRQLPGHHPAAAGCYTETEGQTHGSGQEIGFS